jgi:hypothetical protein
MIHPMSNRPRRRLLAALAMVATIAVGACGSGSTVTAPAASASAPASLGARPSSPATVEVVEPKPGSTVTGTSVHVVLKLNGATIVGPSSTQIRPDQGHVHLYVDNVLKSMNYGLEQDIPVQPGTWVLKAEFVAADHAPFSPRVWSADVVFTVH